MGIVRKLRDGARWIENVAEAEAPRQDPVDPVDQLLGAWAADIAADPFPCNDSSAPEATP